MFLASSYWRALLLWSAKAIPNSLTLQAQQQRRRMDGAQAQCRAMRHALRREGRGHDAANGHMQFSRQQQRACERGHISFRQRNIDLHTRLKRAHRAREGIEEVAARNQPDKDSAVLLVRLAIFYDGQVVQAALDQDL